MAGLIKAALALDRGIVPPTLHCETPNPRIPFDELNLRLVRGGEKIAAGHCAGINSFGFGGTNGHAVLAAPPRRAPAERAAAGPMPPLILSARTQDSLRALAQNWVDTLGAAEPEHVPAMLRAVARRRDQHPQRLVVLATGAGETIAALNDFSTGADNAAAITGTAVREGKLAFVYAGNGAQWAEMGHGAYQASPAFREAIAEADRALRPALGWSVVEAIEDGVSAEQLVHADIAQPLLFAIQVGIVTVLRRLGIEAEGHIGHSVGEIAAAWGAGALTLSDAARVVVARSRQQERTRGDGRMAALALGATAARELLAETGSPLEVGAINARQAVTVSGPSEAIERLGAEARRRGHAFRALELDFAFHSAAMDPICDDLLADLAGLASAAPQRMLVSTVTGEAVPAGLLDGEYWWRNIRRPVCFTDGMTALIGAGFRIFVEIGPNPVLQAYLHDALRAADGQGRVLATLSRKRQDEEPFAAIAANCHVAGYDITGAAQFAGASQFSGLPLYPWQKERFWFERTVEGNNPVDPPFDHPLLGFRQPGPVPFWVNHLDPQVLPWLADHAVEGVPILPAAAVLEMALAAAWLRRPDVTAVEVADVELRRPLPFDMGRPREIRCVIAGEDGDWELSSRPRLSHEPMTVHAVARFLDRRRLPAGAALRRTPGKPRRGRCRRALFASPPSWASITEPQFRTVARIELLGADEASAHLDPSVIDEALDPYLVHPALIDGALQALARADRRPPTRSGRQSASCPGALAGFGSSRRSAARRGRLDCRSPGWDPLGFGDIALFDEVGELVGELSDCWFQRVELTRRVAPEDSALRVDLVPAPLGETRRPSHPRADRRDGAAACCAARRESWRAARNTRC